MGLDKWIKPEDSKKKSSKKERVPVKTKESKSKTVSKKELESPTSKLKKYMLMCPSAKCKYQKTLLKKELTEKDKICPRCNKQLKIKKV
jgi:hypothetical protein